MDRHRVVTLRSPAKVNLTLDVRERLPNGYHLLYSVMQQVSLADEVVVRLEGEQGVRLECSHPEVPCDQTNLAWRAAERFYARLGEEPSVHITLRKVIPPQAGLGGGSSNAATTLRALNILYGQPLSLRELHALASSLGSDVPFFLYGGTALVEGLGEVVTPLPAPASYPLVVAVPPVGVSTAWAYQRLDEERAMGVEELPPPRTPALVSALRAGLNWLPLLHNDFEEVVLPEHPEIQRVKLLMMSSGAEASLLCGSGAGVMGVYPDEAVAQRALLRLRRTGIRCWLCNFCWQ
ncbi:MAG: 4-(cytidine 5'-diphospho)-2-C-methyl-D-erythritol kinase [Armatimonadota bacterium]|nr:4-(cytidine 5'-diphospho)-2-C-methyl-D-erythritol kinase [Armatimonadota bacterium]